MPDLDTGMDKADMKKLLIVSKRQPVNCGVGLTKDGVVLLMDKIKQPKALTKELEKKFSDMKSPHWGTAFVDTDEDPKLVILTLNKAASGMARRMKKTLKGTGFSKVEIRLEDGSVADKAGEEEEEGAEAAPATATSVQPPVTATAPEAPSEEPAEEPSEEPAAPEADASGLDAATLTSQLTGLVKQMLPLLGGDASRAATLKALAAKGQGAIKSGDLPGAQAAIAELQQALAQAPAAGGGATIAPPNMAALGKAAVAWSDTRKKVEGELGKLHKEMTEVYKDHGFGAQLDKVFQDKVEPMLNKLDKSLTDKLNEVTSNRDPAQHAKLVGEAKDIVKNYESYVANEKLIAKLDDNPFVPLQIEKTLTATLGLLLKVIA